jgi:hypothetical protein
MLIVGTRLFGKVDHLPGRFYVATRFAHVNFIPLFPTGSWLVQDGSLSSGITRSSWRGWQLPGVHWPSAAMAWLRVGLALAALAAVVALVAGRGGPAALVAASAAAGFAYSYRLGRATAARVHALCRELGLPADQADALRREAGCR